METICAKCQFFGPIEGNVEAECFSEQTGTTDYVTGEK